MAQVSKLAVNKQTGSDRTVYATWEFDSKVTSSTPATSGRAQVGDWVTIKAGSRWYNGASIPSWVMSDTWKVIQVRGDRAVIHDNRSGSHHIMSPIHVGNLVGGSGAGSSPGGAITTDTIDHYEVKWWYDSGNGVWFVGSESSSVKERQSTYSMPENALRVRVGVKPVSTKHKVNNQDTSYWTGNWSYAERTVTDFPPEVPAVPTVEIDGLRLTAKIENIEDARTDQVEFQVYNGDRLVGTGTVSVKTARAAHSCTVTAGGDYRVRARAVNIVSSGRSYSAWSSYSASQMAAPAAPASITSCAATSSTSVRVEWEASKTAETYELQYAYELRYLDGSSEAKTVKGIESNVYEVTGLDTGRTWFFRVRSVNSEGTSPWTAVKSATVGETPGAPTTWSSSATVTTGQELALHWAHNAPDGSAQTFAEVELTISGTKETRTVRGDASSYEVDTSKMEEGASIVWRVRTAGVTKEYGAWSVTRRVDVYAVPTLTVSVRNSDDEVVSAVTAFPFFLHGLAGPKTQEPTGYHVEVVAGQSYTATDQTGRVETVLEGDAVYSRYVDTSDALLIEFGPGNIDLEPGVAYEVRVTVSMDSGLTASASTGITAAWEDFGAEPDLEIAVDDETWTAHLKPYVMADDGSYLDGYLLNVYRREFDGSFTELASGLDSADGVVVTDPHPALDYARYRVVSVAKDTGAVAFYDPPGYPVACKSVVIQWDEEWSEFDSLPGELAEQPWAGSMVELPYNITVSDSADRDVQAVSYAGRKNPVSYYGTLLGSKSSWSVRFPRSDTATLYALRRLAAWMGDCYVREPSGTGYWAAVDVSLDLGYGDSAATASFDIERVEGGA